MQNCKQVKMKEVFSTVQHFKILCFWSCCLAEGVSRQTVLHAVNVDRKVTCFITFQFSMFYWTFTVAYSIAKLKIKGNKGSPHFTLFIHFATETLKYPCSFFVCANETNLPCGVGRCSSPRCSCTVTCLP